MSKILIGLAAAGVTAMLALPAPATAEERPDGVRNVEQMEFSARRRGRRHVVRHHHGPRAYHRSWHRSYRHAYAPRYRSYRYAYAPHYRSYRYAYAPRYRSYRYAYWPRYRTYRPYYASYYSPYYAYAYSPYYYSPYYYRRGPHFSFGPYGFSIGFGF